MKNIGILGGTFDPIHYGDLRIAIEVKHLLSLSEVRLVPSANPPTLGKPSSLITPANYRLKMVKVALENQNDLVLDDREFTHSFLKQLQGPNSDAPIFSFHTLKTIREENELASICFILGMDVFSLFHTWYKSEEILKIANLIIVPRWGQQTLISDDSVISYWKNYMTKDISKIKNNTCGYIYTAPIGRLDISSSMIRDHFKNGINPKYLLPEDVLDLILNSKYYK